MRGFAQPLITVIVPVYNAEAYIGQCVDSILTQTYEKLEIILIDDGSKDACPEICDAYEKKNARVRVVHKDNGGVSSARNMGLVLATGDFVMFVDADDELPENACQEMLDVAICNDADIVAGRYVGGSLKWKTKDVCFAWNGDEGLRNSLLDNPFTYSAWAKLYTRKFVGETRFRENIKINEDSLFIFDLLCKQPVFVCINKEIYKVNANPNSASRASFSDRFFDISLVSNIKYDFVKEHKPDFIPLAENMKIKADMNLLLLLKIRTTGEYADLERELAFDIKHRKKFFRPVNYRDAAWFVAIIAGLYRLVRAPEEKI